MQAMYSMVAQELKSAQLVDSHPCDYLNFYCLGNREEISKEASQNSTDCNQVLLVIFSNFSFWQYLNMQVFRNDYRNAVF